MAAHTGWRWFRFRPKPAARGTHGQRRPLRLSRSTLAHHQVSHRLIGLRLVETLDGTGLAHSEFLSDSAPTA